MTDLPRTPPPTAPTPPHDMPSAVDLLQAVQQLLTPQERYLAEQRALGRDWAALAAELGGQPDALRMQLARAMDRVARQLGL